MTANSSAERNRELLRFNWYLPERIRHGRAFLTDLVVDRLAAHRVAASTVQRGITGFGVHAVPRSDSLLSLSEDPPVVVSAVDAVDTIRAAATGMSDLPAVGVLSLERAHRPESMGDKGGSRGGSARLTINLRRHQRVDGRPAAMAVCGMLRDAGAWTAAAFLAVDGTVGGQRRRAKFFHHNVSVPLCVEAIGNLRNLTDAAAAVRSVLPDALVFVESVTVCRADGTAATVPAAGLQPAQITSVKVCRADGTTVAGHRPFGSAGAASQGATPGGWARITVHSDAADRHDGEPVHRALVRRLRAGGSVGGATVLRGIWGFRDGQPAHGDRLFQLGRRVPVTTAVLGTHAGLALAWPVIEEVTAEHGVVVFEGVPVLAHSVAGLVLADGLT